MVLAEISLYEQSMRECEEQLARWHADDEIVHKLDEISGIGLLTASALKTAVGKPERFASGHHLSAWLGMTPNEYSSGERRRLGRISTAGRQALQGTNPGTPNPATTLGLADGRTHRPQQGRGRTGKQDGEDLLGGVVSRATLQRQLAECKARLTAEVIRKV